MSDKMTPIPFPGLMEWMLNEHSSQGTVFGIHRPFVADKEKAYEIFGRKLETPFGPAAGPHTQLAQNIMAAYYAGRIFLFPSPASRRTMSATTWNGPQSFTCPRRLKST